ncbi:FAD-dependent oxidoreductase [Adlercreutzia sp. R25]|uniref:FAD-dependent oxidoreductase n=1 Tax=Adlercreutzia shanghongiae TaxID=3111773 RepID=UPI002DB780CF|nr:FAD-dependent oxidoreductase [Adlercreutzia sp. R25]MEC4272105.1 FAD-dependent oxidoreductase [Adlercreutzia sp. R25]
MEMTRRGFVGGAALASIGALSATMLAGCSQESDASEPLAESGADAAAWDREADFIVVGGGGAGIAAAIGAANAGASVLVLEKAPEKHAGGATSVVAGIVNMWSEDKNPASNWVQYRTMGYKSAERGQKWGENLPDLLDILEDHGMGWETGSRPESGPGNIADHGPALYAALMDAMNEAGAEIVYESPVTKIVTNSETGEAIGVYADQNGSQVAIKANKGVLVSTGSYASNPELINSIHLPGFEYFSEDSPYNTGDAFQLLAGDLGAATMGFRDIEYDTPAIKLASKEVGTSVGLAKAFAVPSYLYVNGAGSRFMPEDLAIMHNKDVAFPWLAHSRRNPDANEDGFEVAMENYVNKTSFIVLDQACFDAGSLGNTNWTWSWSHFKDEGDSGYLWSEDNQAELAKGWILQGNTIEELAQQMGVDPTALSATVANYNQMASAGEDTELGRAAEAMQPLGDGPYYAIELGVSVLFTTAGIRSDDQDRVVKWDLTPIERLYVTGNAGMNMFVSPGVLTVLAAGYTIGQDVASLDAIQA